MSIKQIEGGVLVLMAFFLIEGNVHAREETVPDTENVLVYPSIAVALLRSQLIRQSLFVYQKKRPEYL